MPSLNGEYKQVVGNKTIVKYVVEIPGICMQMLSFIYVILIKRLPKDIRKSLRFKQMVRQIKGLHTSKFSSILIVQRVNCSYLNRILHVGLRTCTSLILERLRYPVSVLRVRVSPFCLPIFADVSIFTRNFYPFPRGKPWSTRKRQTGTGVFYLLFVGRLNSQNFQHLTQINNTLMLVKVFNIYSEPQ